MGVNTEPRERGHEPERRQEACCGEREQRERQGGVMHRVEDRHDAGCQLAPRMRLADPHAFFAGDLDTAKAASSDGVRLSREAGDLYYL